MSLGKSKIFRAFAYTIAGLAVLSFVARVALMVTTGHATDTYKNVKGLEWTYSSALVLLVVTGLLLIAVAIHRLWSKFRDR
jgi:hypothetical protein